MLATVLRSTLRTARVLERARTLVFALAGSLHSRLVMDTVVFSCAHTPALCAHAVVLFNEIADPTRARAMPGNAAANASLLVSMGGIDTSLDVRYLRREEWPLLDRPNAPGESDDALRARLLRHVIDLVQRKGWVRAAIESDGGETG